MGFFGSGNRDQFCVGAALSAYVITTMRIPKPILIVSIVLLAIVAIGSIFA